MPVSSRAVTCVLPFLAAASCYAQSRTRPTIFCPARGSSREILAAKEVRRHIYLRTNLNLTLKRVASIPGRGHAIVVANSRSDLLKGLRLGYSPKAGEIVLKSIRKGGRSLLVITGGDPDATLVAAYRFAERLGVGFDLAGDAIPAQVPRGRMARSVCSERMVARTDVGHGRADPLVIERRAGVGPPLQGGRDPLGDAARAVPSAESVRDAVASCDRLQSRCWPEIRWP